MSARPSMSLRVAFGSTLAVLALACGSSPDERETGPAPSPRVVEAGDPRVERLLATTIRSQSVAGGVKQVAFDLHSLAGDQLVIAWSVEWFDRDGRPLDASSSAWRRITLPAGGVIPLEIRAPVPEADSWRLRAVDSRTLE